MTDPSWCELKRFDAMAIVNQWPWLKNSLEANYYVRIDELIDRLGIKIWAVQGPDGYHACVNVGSITQQPEIYIDAVAAEEAQRFLLAQMLWYVLNKPAGQYKVLYWNVRPPIIHRDLRSSWIFACNLLMPKYIFNCTWDVWMHYYKPVSLSDRVRGWFNVKQRVDNHARWDACTINWRLTQMAKSFRVPFDILMNSPALKEYIGHDDR